MHCNLFESNACQCHLGKILEERDFPHREQKVARTFAGALYPKVIESLQKLFLIEHKL